MSNIQAISPVTLDEMIFLVSDSILLDACDDGKLTIAAIGDSLNSLYFYATASDRRGNCINAARALSPPQLLIRKRTLQLIISLELDRVNNHPVNRLTTVEVTSVLLETARTMFPPVQSVLKAKLPLGVYLSSNRSVILIRDIFGTCRMRDNEWITVTLNGSLTIDTLGMASDD